MKAKQVHPTIASALLVDARRRAGLTQEEVARRAGVARPSISQYENGKKDPSVMNLNRLIQACGMEPAPARGSLERGRSSSGVSRCRGGNRRGSTKCTASAGWLGADASADAGRESWIERLSPRCLGVRRPVFALHRFSPRLVVMGSTLSLSEVMEPSFRTLTSR